MAGSTQGSALKRLLEEYPKPKPRPTRPKHGADLLIAKSPGPRPPAGPPPGFVPAAVPSDQATASDEPAPEIDDADIDLPNPVWPTLDGSPPPAPVAPALRATGCTGPPWPSEPGPPPPDASPGAYHGPYLNCYVSGLHKSNFYELLNFVL